MSAPTNDRRGIDRDLAATAALALYSFVVAIGFARVFSGWRFLVDLGLIVIVGHGASFALRRARVSGWIAVPGVTALLMWLLLALHFDSTMTYLIPRGATWDAVDLEVSVVRSQFETAIAPVNYGPGWAALAGLSLVIAVVMADSFAFRAEARGEALVPGGVLFVFIAALGSPRLRIVGTALLIAAGVIAVVALRALHDRSRRVELTSRRGSHSMIVPTAVATAVAVAVLAGVVGPRIPGAKAEPLYETKGRGGGVTDVVNPLVDIRSRLTNRGNVELFRVNAEAPAYWRVTTLPEFNGTVFRLSARPLEDVESIERDPAPDDVLIRQQIQILSLGGQLVPAAAAPVTASGTMGGRSVRLQINRETSTLIPPQELAPADEFTVESSAPRLDSERLRAATADNAPDPIFVELPDNLPDLVSDLAAEVTAGAATDYDAAVALQEWFRNDFDYSLEVQQGHGSNAIESFLNQRVGYCEQFSATYAAMARTLGIPSRVAVGYTPGLLNESGWYSVRGKNAHAWPELWFDGLGWVAFEPTPGRGAPGAEAYTGLEPEQDTSPPAPAGAGGTGGDGAAPNPTTPATVVPPATSVPNASDDTIDPGSPLAPGILPDGGEAVPLNDADGGAPESGSGFPWRLVVFVVVVAVIAFGPWLIRRWRARIARAHGGAERVQLAWNRARSAAEDAGVVGRASMTTHEWALATAAQLPVAARPMGSLADVVSRVSFAPPDSVDLDRSGGFGPTLGHDCELWSEQVSRIAVDTLTPWQRLKRYYTEWT